MIFNSNNEIINLRNSYVNSSCFFIGGGPSFENIDKDKLNSPGIITVGVNNSVKTFRPDIWVSVDDPTHFIKSIWLDGKIKKIVPIEYVNRKIFDNDKWEESNILVKDCPNVLFFKRNEEFNENTYLTEDTVNWGNPASKGGSRSVMLAALKILYYLGFKNVFLLGVDFKMNPTYKYHFSQDRTVNSLNGNNKTYMTLIDRFTKLKPYFDKDNFNVYNCNEESELKVFPYKSFDNAIEFSLDGFPKDLKNERTEGLYERIAMEKKEKKDKLLKAAKERRTLNDKYQLLKKEFEELVLSSNIENDNEEELKKTLNALEEKRYDMDRARENLMSVMNRPIK